jgi:hypothetical protein
MTRYTIKKTLACPEVLYNYAGWQVFRGCQKAATIPSYFSRMQAGEVRDALNEAIGIKKEEI